MQAALRLTNVERQAGAFHLGPLNWEVPKGGVTALIGPNGAGKTTTIDLVMGMGAASHGSIEVLGLSMPRDEVPIKARIGYVSPDLNFTPWAKVGRALDFVRGFYPDWDQARCERLMGALGIARGERIAALSFGARIKLALVMALSRDPDLLLLDEPTTGLDVAARQVLFREILEFVRRDDKAVVISSHQLSDLERLADHVAILHRGKLLTMGRMDELVDRYVQLDLLVTTGCALPALVGVRPLGQEGERHRVLFDRAEGRREEFAALGIEILAEAPLTLEEVFLALTQGERSA